METANNSEASLVKKKRTIVLQFLCRHRNKGEDDKQNYIVLNMVGDFGFHLQLFWR